MHDMSQTQKQHVFIPWSVQGQAEQMRIKHAQGVELEFADGKKALDMCSFLFNANIGHGHPAVQEAILRAAKDPCVAHPAMYHEEKAKLGETLARITSGDLVKTFFTLGGAEANENAIKIARMMTGRYKVVTRYRSYHGATLATLGYGGDYRRIPFDGNLTGVIRIPDPYPRGSGQKIDTVRLLEEILEIEGPETVACVLLEGITGANGVFVPDADYWPRIRELCTRHSILLIADEVMSGFGRTGKWFAVDHYGVTPDIMTLAKGLTGGYAPLGAVVVNESVAKHFDDHMLWCGLTAYAHPLCCTIANAVIEVYEKEGLIENARIRGEELKEMLANLQKQNPMVSETRSIGLMAAVELRKGPNDDRPYVAYRAKGDEAKKSTQLQKALLANGVFCAVRFNTVLIVPPLCITKAQLADGMAKIEQTLREHL